MSCKGLLMLKFVTSTVDIQHVYTIFSQSTLLTPHKNISKPSNSMMISGNLLIFRRLHRVLEKELAKHWLIILYTSM